VVLGSGLGGGPIQIAVLGGELVAKVGIYEAGQLTLTLLALATAALNAKYPIGVFAEFEGLVTRISTRPYLSAALIAAAATSARLALSPFLGVPEPVVPDEVSLIFQAETYVTGHFANHVNLFRTFCPSTSISHLHTHRFIRSFDRSRCSLAFSWALGPGVAFFSRWLR
jgi:hypothetical protein